MIDLHPGWQRINHAPRIGRRPPRHTAFGAALKTAREAAGLSQRALTNCADVSEGLVSRWETGKREPTAATVGRLADALGLTGIARDRLFVAA
jgi:transcriptional regulator with XRE-family HTH domain